MDEQKMPRRPRRSSTEEQPKNERLVYGKNHEPELQKSGSGVDTVLIAEGMAPAVAAYYTAMAKEAGATVKRVHPNMLRLMTGTESHQGVAAFASEIEYVTVEDLLNIAREKGEPPFLVLSDGIEDPHNLGAVMRSALLCGAHGIVIPKRGGASVTPTVIKSSAGAAERLPVARVANIGETIRREKALSRCGAAGYGRAGHRCGQLQCLGGGWHHPVRDPEPARRRVRNSGQTAVTRTGRD